jgi:molybdate transport system substrate-binding protein
LAALGAKQVKRIAIANPGHAPYGRAAKAALVRAGIYELIKDKLVLGENISQATQFVQTGNAQAGIIALSLALSPRMQSEGKYWVVPEQLYPRLEQAVVILKSSRNPLAAEAFLQFLKSEPGISIMQRYGFVSPQMQKEKP